jgi:hypothetical protein
MFGHRLDDRGHLVNGRDLRLALPLGAAAADNLARIDLNQPGRQL